MGISGREESLGGKDGGAQLHSSGPVALILSQLLHVVLWHSLNDPCGKTPSLRLCSSLRWLHVVMMEFGSISWAQILLDDCTAAQRSNTHPRQAGEPRAGCEVSSNTFIFSPWWC